MVLTAHNVRDAEVGIVRAGSQMISGRAITAEEREVFDIVGRFGKLAVNQVMELHDFAGPHLVPQDEGLARGCSVIAFVFREFAMARDGVGSGRGEIAIREAFIVDGLAHRFVKRKTFGLAILLVPRQVEPFETFKDGLQRFFGIALEIGVVDPKNHGAAVPAGV